MFSFSKASVSFLDTKLSFIEVENWQIYFANSGYPTFISTAAPLIHFILFEISNSTSQLFRTNRICTDISDSWKHANAFIQHYLKCSYSESRLVRIDKISKNRQTSRYILNKPNTVNDNISLVINCHQHSLEFQNYCMKYYQYMAKKYPPFQLCFSSAAHDNFWPK